MDNSASSNTTAPKCFSDGKKAVTKAAEHVSIGFVDGTTPALDEDLGYVPHQGPEAFKAIQTALNSCGTITVNGGGDTFTGSMGQMSFPVLADQSEAWQVNLTESKLGLNLGIDIVAFQKGSTVGAVEYTDLGTPDVSAFQGYAEEAVSKLR